MSKDIVIQNKDKYEKNTEEIENAIEEYEQNRGVIDERCNLPPESEVVRLECIEELETRQPDHESEQENVPDYSRQAVTEARVIGEPPAKCIRILTKSKPVYFTQFEIGA